MNELFTYKIEAVDAAHTDNCRWTCDLYTVNPETFELNYFTCKFFRGEHAALNADNYGKDFCQRINKGK